MMTFLYFLSMCFHAILLELYEGLEDAVQVVFCEARGLDLLQSLEGTEELLCEEDFLCGVSHQ